MECRPDWPPTARRCPGTRSDPSTRRRPRRRRRGSSTAACDDEEAVRRAVTAGGAAGCRQFDHVPLEVPRRGPRRCQRKQKADASAAGKAQGLGHRWAPSLSGCGAVETAHAQGLQFAFQGTRVAPVGWGARATRRRPLPAGAGSRPGRHCVRGWGPQARAPPPIGRARRAAGRVVDQQVEHRGIISRASAALSSRSRSRSSRPASRERASASCPSLRPPVRPERKRSSSSGECKVVGQPTQFGRAVGILGAQRCPLLGVDSRRPCGGGGRCRSGCRTCCRGGRRLRQRLLRDDRPLVADWALGRVGRAPVCDHDADGHRQHQPAIHRRPCHLMRRVCVGPERCQARNTDACGASPGVTAVAFPASPVRPAYACAVAAKRVVASGLGAAATPCRLGCSGTKPSISREPILRGSPPA